MPYWKNQLGWYDGDGAYWAYTDDDIIKNRWAELPEQVEAGKLAYETAVKVKSGGMALKILDVHETIANYLGESIVDIKGDLNPDEIVKMNSLMDELFVSDEPKEVKNMGIADTFFKATKNKAVVKRVAYKAPAKKTVAKKTVAKTAMQKKMAKVRAAKKK
jgi:hypothetical protein